MGGGGVGVCGGQVWGLGLVMEWGEALDGIPALQQDEREPTEG